MPDDDLIALTDRWSALGSELGRPDDRTTAAVGRELIDRYAEPQRHYHTVAHLSAVLRVLDELAPDRPAAATRLAAWFHDVVYDPTAPDNEERSADLATDRLGHLELPTATIDLVAALVLATKTHDPGNLPEADLLLDADLSILGTDANTYERFAVGVRSEYGHVADDLYAIGRSMVLQSFLERDHIFLTPAGRERFEIIARTNLADELERLNAP